jgi:hypothetical protein
VPTPHDRVDAVCADDEIAVVEARKRVERQSEFECGADLLALRLKQPQELEPSDRAETIPVDVDSRIAMNDALDRPCLQYLRKRRVHRRHITREEFQRTVREHDAEAERRVTCILLEDAHLDVRAAPFDEIGEEQARRSGSGDTDTHDRIRLARRI